MEALTRLAIYIAAYIQSRNAIRLLVASFYHNTLIVLHAGRYTYYVIMH